MGLRLLEVLHPAAPWLLAPYLQGTSAGSMVRSASSLAPFISYLHYIRRMPTAAVFILVFLPLTRQKTTHVS